MLANDGNPMDKAEIDNTHMLVTAWYWAFQTVTTVGYGDIPTANYREMVFRMICMILGVIIFSEFLNSIGS